MGENTEMIGLGDMGSGLHTAFDEALRVMNPAEFWEADWKHTRDYIDDAGKILTGVDVQAWEDGMRQAIWDRDETRRDDLLSNARNDRLSDLPAGVTKLQARLTPRQRCYLAQEKLKRST